jgi:hypothetical protein
MFESLKQYKDIFGKPNEGVHSYRLFDVAIVDLLLTILLAFLISYFFLGNVFKNFIYASICLIFIGMASHRAFGVKTKW